MGATFHPRRVTLDGFCPRVRSPGCASSQRDSGQSGFTIAEVMFAMIVLVFAITTSITVMQRGFNSLDSARGTTYATQIMQTEIEKLRLCNWSTVSGYGSSTTLTIDSAFTSNPVIASHYTLTRTASTVHTGMIQVTFTVSWTGYDGRPQSRSCTTYYGQNGLYDYVSS